MIGNPLDSSFRGKFDYFCYKVLIMPIQDFAKKLLDLLVEPSDYVEKLDERRNVRLFSAVLVIMLISLIPPAFFTLDINMPKYIFIVLSSGLLVAYVLSRTRFYAWGIWISLLFLIGFSFAPLFSATKYNAFEVAQNVMWVVLPLILTSIFLPRKKIIIFAIVVLGVLLISPVIVESLQLAYVMPVFGFVLTWFAAHMALLNHNRLLEMDRQTELRLKAMELAAVNEDLSTEIIDRITAERKIEESLHEKEVLLKEIHHRVKNNLQVISSLLNLQSGLVANEEALSVFQDSQNRIRSMALIHELLYRSLDLAKVDFADYVRRLAVYLWQSYGGQERNIGLDVQAETIYLGIDTAVPLGLILNELISNALKHAFPDGRSGEIVAALSPDPSGEVHLCVRDNGVGLPAGLDFLHTSSLGLQLVHTLLGQINGRLHHFNQNGATITVIFNPGPTAKP